MIDPNLTNPNVSVHPPHPLPPDQDLRQVKVVVRYATSAEVQPHQMLTPYDPMTLTVAGDLITVANWLDEHIVAAACAFAGTKYAQLEAGESIKRALLRGGIYDLENSVLHITRILPPTPTHKETTYPALTIEKQWSDQDTIGAVKYSDGYVLAFDEKSAVLVNPAGVIIDTWWKETPSGAHWHVFLTTGNVTNAHPLTQDQKDIIFKAGHHTLPPTDPDRVGAHLLELFT